MSFLSMRPGDLKLKLEHILCILFVMISTIHVFVYYYHGLLVTILFTIVHLLFGSLIWILKDDVANKWLSQRGGKKAV
jgi:hypothetical protein